MKYCLKKATYFFSLWTYLFLAPLASAQEGDTYSHLEEDIGTLSYNSIMVSALILLILITISLLLKKITSGQKKILFLSICIVTISQTLFLAGSTIYINSISHSKGPVHYHADIEVFNCGEKVDFLDPTGLSNKIGTSTLHEHNDGRIHLEGVVIEGKDQSLGKFFYVIDGHLDSSSISLPSTNGQLDLINGMSCSDESLATVNVFVYRIVNGFYVQEKLKEPENYIYAPQSQVPPGDCIIIEFGPEKDSTDKLCTSYKAAEETGKIKNGGNLKDY